ncbi:conserved exported hypothetical protein [Flavobacterium psychrophilum]|nr:conserved exported hypothetical protein [Flavobacterium psychrophilum]SNB10828.1 conserved exported hypothetical protein [Flavobacterium psychrophilum]SNB10940.1 conserved exported hypothetical protein [Flavobacterium psychrophilum]SNB29422.1 conserved exported hypothetical protein [Flavobacterium psychrophilum]SNB33584.1 conserved exported hypothetical protein [Flavobacterium psychrophilum]
MKPIPKKLTLTLLAILSAVFTHAAPPSGPPPPAPPPPGLPINNGILWLAFVAIAYGFYTLRKFKLQSK